MRRHFLNTYFWRTKQGQEIDYLEEYDGQLNAYKIKWDKKRNRSAPVTFTNTYPAAHFETITPARLTSFVALG